MSGLSLDGTGLAAVMPSTGNTYVPGLTLSRGLSIVDAVGQTNPSSGLVLRGSGLSFGITAGAPLNAAVSAWAADVVANGGTVSLPRAILVSTLVEAWIAAGVWDLTDDAWLLVGENTPQALTSLKQRRLATVVAAPTFTASRGYVFNGTSNYINTGFIPLTHAVAMTDTLERISAYERTNVGIAGRHHGTFDSSTKCLYINPRTSTSTYEAGANGTISSTGTSTTSLGLTTSYRSGATLAIQKNGVQVVTTTPTTGAGLPTRAIYIGALNNAGTANQFRAATVGFACVGAAMTDPQELAFYTPLQTFMTAIGANV